MPISEPISQDDGDTESISSAVCEACNQPQNSGSLQHFPCCNYLACCVDDGVNAICQFCRLDLRELLEEVLRSTEPPLDLNASCSTSEWRRHACSARWGFKPDLRLCQKRPKTFSSPQTTPKLVLSFLRTAVANTASSEAAAPRCGGPSPWRGDTNVCDTRCIPDLGTHVPCEPLWTMPARSREQRHQWVPVLVFPQTPGQLEVVTSYEQFMTSLRH